MAWRIDEAVTHGEIDNTIEGHTTGRIWLVGRNAPMVLSLVGDCWRDLAGTRLRFDNPTPQAVDDIHTLDLNQSGIVGDMTASRKNKVPTVDDEEFHRLCQSDSEIPYEWKNILSLEWFSEANGRVVIESSTYKLEISPHEWQMDEDAEEAQKMANMNAMRDFMALIIRRPEPSESEDTDELDEYAWEERLKESDRLTDAYQEVLEKYMEDSDCEQKEAFVMGWDGLLDAMAERDEACGDGFSVDEDEQDESYGWRGRLRFDLGREDEEAFSGSNDDDIHEDQDHPLQNKAQELAMRAMDVVHSDAGPGSPAYQLVSALLQVSGKLAGALNNRSSGDEPENGYVLAVLKRCLNWLNEAVGACQKLMVEEGDADQLAALAHLRSTAFEIRDEITELRRSLKWQ